MTTSNKYLSLTEKRILGWQSFKDNLFDYWSGWVQDLQKRVFSRSGTFLLTNLVGAGADHFSLVDYLEDEVAALDGEGNLLSPDARPTDVADVVFENALGVTYHVGIQRANIPSGLHVNPVDGMPFFDSFEEIIGVAGTPNAVVDNGTTLTFTVNGITQSGVSFAGRKVKVWKIGPGKEALTESVGLEECTVAFTTPNNKITTVGNFGQGTSPSTTAAHYVVVLIGPKVSTISLVADPVACYIGNILGVGIGSEPTVFDMSEQYVISDYFNKMSDVIRTEPSNGRLKIDVKALGTESGIDQIRVTKVGSGIKFQVDEDGNVEIQGDLTVQGTETIYNTEIVYADETITGNLTAGDAAADSHKIKGTWWHTNVAESATYFKVNGATGEVGIGDDPETGFALHVLGKTWQEGQLEISYNDPLVFFDDVGAVANWRFYSMGHTDRFFTLSSWNDAKTLQDPWLNVLKGAGTHEVTHVDIRAAYDVTSAIHLESPTIRVDGVLQPEGNIIPDITNSYDLGADSFRLKDAYFQGVVYGNEVGFFSKGTLAGLALSRTSDAIADRRYWEISTQADGTLDFRGRNNTLALSYTWLKVTKRNAIGNYHSAQTIELNSVGSIDLESALVSVTGNFSVSGNVTSDLIPSGTRVLGSSPSNYWNAVYGTTVDTKILNVADGTPGTYGLGTSIIPITDSLRSLGDDTHRFLKLWVDELSIRSGTNQGIASDFYPKSDLTWDLGDAARRFAIGYFGNGYFSGNSYGKLFMRDSSATNQAWTVEAGLSFSIHARTDTFIGGSEAIRIERTGTTPTVMKVLPDVLPFTDYGAQLGSADLLWESLYVSSARFHSRSPQTLGVFIQLRDEASTATFQSWQIQLSSNKLQLTMPPDNFATSGNPALRFTRYAASPTHLHEIIFGEDSLVTNAVVLRPGTDYMGELGSSSFRWGMVHSYTVDCTNHHASWSRYSGTSGGDVNTLTIQYDPRIVTAGGRGNPPVSNGNNGVGWLALRLGTSLIYVPYWTAIS